MATVTVSDSRRTIDPSPEMRDFLGRHGIAFETWPVPPAMADLQAAETLAKEQQDQVLGGFRPQLDREARERGYIQSDMIILNPNTPGLEDALAKFDRPHYHDDDEVRFIFAGEGVFGFEPEDAPPFTVTVTAGDYIIVPKKTYHWFTLTDRRTIKAVRLFKNTSGWVPHYKREAAG